MHNKQTFIYNFITCHLNAKNLNYKNIIISFKDLIYPPKKESTLFCIHFYILSPKESIPVHLINFFLLMLCSTNIEVRMYL